MRGWHGRLEKLEGVVPSSSVNRRRERKRWDRLTAELLAHLAEPAWPAAVGFLDREFGWVAVWEGVRLAEVRRWPKALLAFCRTLADPDLAAELVGSGPLTANATTRDPCDPWLWSWLSAITRLQSRLPPDLNPQTLRRMAEFHRAGRANYTVGACDGCGLRWPVGVGSKANDLWAACGHCGGKAWTWEMRAHDVAHPWQALGRSELDPV